MRTIGTIVLRRRAIVPMANLVFLADGSHCEAESNADDRDDRITKESDCPNREPHPYCRQ